MISVNFFCGCGRKKFLVLVEKKLLVLIKKSFWFWSNMLVARMAPDRVTYNSVISACEKGQQPEWALKVFDTMQQQGLLPDVITYSAKISACEKGRQPKLGLQVFEAMQQ